MPPCKSFPWTGAYKYSTICISPRRGSGRECRTDHFQDGCRHFARYTPKVLLPTKFQLACVAAGLYVYAYSYARRENKRNTTLVAAVRKRRCSLPRLSLSAFLSFDHHRLVRTGINLPSRIWTSVANERPAPLQMARRPSSRKFLSRATQWAINNSSLTSAE